jgi:early secretory antigenic target protein ESAT-6
VSNDYTLVNFGAMKEAQASFNKALSEYKAALSDLQSKVQSTLAEWEGDADEAYKAMQKQWNAAGDQLGQVVHNMGQAIGDSHDGYLATERRNTAMFGG